ncbi:MAG TPA: DNA-binding protein [Pirellulales bacterium]|jgi:hypothetical protein
MDGESLSAQQAARQLGVAVTTLYDWLGQSDYGLLVIRGQPFTINYLQGGPQGQGRIMLDIVEVGRIRDAMRVIPQHARLRRPPLRRESFPGINVTLGRPGR